MDLAVIGNGTLAALIYQVGEHDGSTLSRSTSGDRGVCETDYGRKGLANSAGVVRPERHLELLTEVGEIRQPATTEGR